jgi:hypothetical protein
VRLWSASVTELLIQSPVDPVASEKVGLGPAVC